MNTFFMFGKYSSEGIRDISGERTEQVRRTMQKLGGDVRDIYALLGEHDLVLIVDFPTMTDAMKAAIVLGQRTGVTFATAAAIPIHEFDQLAENLDGAE